MFETLGLFKRGLTSRYSLSGKLITMEKNDFLWKLYVSEREFIRHHENQRTSASNIMAAIAAGLIVALGTDQLSTEIRILISSLLTGMGLFGFVFCGKLYALIKLHGERSYQYLEILDKSYTNFDIKEIKNKAKAKNKDEFKGYKNLGLNKIWKLFHLFICLTGVGLFFYYLISFLTSLYPLSTVSLLKIQLFFDGAHVLGHLVLTCHRL